ADVVGGQVELEEAAGLRLHDVQQVRLVLESADDQEADVEIGVFGGEADRLVQLDVAFETRGVDGRDGGGDRVALGERLGGHALLGPEPAGEGDHAVLTPNGPVAFGCGHSASSFHVRPPAGVSSPSTPGTAEGPST